MQKSIDRAASIDPADYDNLHFGSYANAVRYRNEARTLQMRILNSTPGEISSIPELANNIVDISSREAYKIGRTYRTGYLNNRMQGGSVFLPTLPHSLRRAVDTEGRVATGGEIPILGNTVASNKSMTLSDGTNLNMFQFRMAGHKIILPDVATAEGLGLYATKGGFDLDDKLITNLHYVTDSNNNRSLAAFAWRQPTGPQEFSLITPHMDEGTFTNLFGSDNILGDKFKRLAEVVSDNISENKIGQMRTLASAQMNPEELARLSREERIVLYANSLLSGNKKAANMYKGSMDIQGGELEKLVFSLTDVGKDGGGFNFDLGTGTGVNIGLDDMGSFQQRDFINLTQLDARVAKKAAEGGRGAPLTFTDLEYEGLARDNPVFATHYRNSQFIKLFDANTKLKEDSIFTSEIKDLYQTIYGSESYTQYGTDLRSQTQRKLNDTEVAYRGLGRILEDSTVGNESRIKALNAATKLNQRNALSGVGAENGLGKYVDTLNWAASSEEQRIAVLSRIESEGYEGLANNLRLNLMPIFSPEGAIDPALGGTSILSFGGNLQDMRDSIRMYHSRNGVILNPGQIEEAVNRSVYNLVGRSNEDLDAFSALYVEANPSKYATAEKAKAAFFDDANVHFKAFLELSEGDYAPQLNELIKVSTENIRMNMINQTGLLTGQIRGAQILLGHQDEDLLGFDQLVTRSKFNVSAKSGELDNLIGQTLAGFESAKGMALSGELPNDPAALARIENYIQRLGQLKKSLGVEDNTAVTPEYIREELINLMNLSGKAKDKYGTSSLPLAAEEAQKMIFKFKNLIRDQAVEKDLNSVLGPKIEELFGMIESSIKDEILDPSEVGKVGVVERILENKNLVKEIQNRAKFYGEKDPLYKALIGTQLIDETEIEAYGAKFGLQSAEDAIGLVQSSALMNTRKVLINQMQSELDNRRFTSSSS